MKLTLNWLKKFLKTDASLTEISQILTAIGFEVESMTDLNSKYASYIIAHIESATPHPDATKLKVCMVNTGVTKLQIVCGASNAREGLKVVLAPVGTIMPDGLQIKASKIRGVESNGMLCSSEELDLSNDSDGIMELPEDAPMGTPFKDFMNLNDSIIELSITPNRGDAINILGIARDLAAANAGEFLPPQDYHDISYNTSIDIALEAKDACRQFYMLRIDDVDNTKAVTHLDSYLQLIGMQPNSPLVSISNFAMHEIGRPNHFYDADKIKDKISIRRSFEAEKFTPIGEAEIELPAGICVIADEEKILAIAGVMGGELSKIDANTKSILVEIAYFDHIEVAKAGRATGILSDSRFRFERRVDYGNTEFFAEYIANLIITNLGGKLTGASKQFGDVIEFPKECKIDYKLISKLACQNLESREIDIILSRLGFEKITNDICSIPTFRQNDVTSAIDIAEEVLRIKGLDGIPKQELSFTMKDPIIKSEKFKNTASDYLVNNGFMECINLSFISKKESDLFASNNPFTLINPISSELSVMRQTLLAGLLKGAAKNYSHGVEDFALFECGNLYFKKADAQLSEEKSCIAALLVGMKHRKTHIIKDLEYSFFDIKKYAEELLQIYGLDPSKFEYSKEAPSYYHPGQSACIKLGKMSLAFIGKLHPTVLKEMNCPDNAIAMELFVSNLPALKKKNAKSKLEISYLQKSYRDFAFIVDAKTDSGALLKAIKALEPKLIERVDLFDVYKGQNIEHGKKSLGISINIRPFNETLTEADIDAICQKIILMASQNYGASLRSSSSS